MLGHLSNIDMNFLMLLSFKLTSQPQYLRRYIYFCILMHFSNGVQFLNTISILVLFEWVYAAAVLATVIFILFIHLQFELHKV